MIALTGVLLHSPAPCTVVVNGVSPILFCCVTTAGAPPSPGVSAPDSRARLRTHAARPLVGPRHELLGDRGHAGKRLQIAADPRAIVSHHVERGGGRRGDLGDQVTVVSATNIKGKTDFTASRIEVLNVK